MNLTPLEFYWNTTSVSAVPKATQKSLVLLKTAKLRVFCSLEFNCCCVLFLKIKHAKVKNNMATGEALEKAA